MDIGYAHTTILLVEENKIVAFETFPIGTEMLVNIISENHPNLSLIQIENLLCSSSEIDSMQVEIKQFLEYLLDVIGGFFENHENTIKQKHIFCYGGFFENTHAFSLFSQHFSDIF